MYPTAPAIVGQYDTDGSSGGVAISENYVYVGDGDAGIVVLDVSDPTDPVFAGGYDTPGYVGRLMNVGDLLCVADDRLVILRVDKADTPRKCDLNGDELPLPMSRSRFRSQPAAHTTTQPTSTETAASPRSMRA